uniref:NAD-dependent epimerase/dehydratase domain-containing protein n=1 Tax=Aegilops tauschii subsp. strangulata TaxID=200361 RepID=A0A453D2I1_AEGTS
MCLKRGELGDHQCPAMSAGEMQKTACVTGGSGYIASALVKTLLEKGYAVKTTVRDPGWVLVSSFLVLSSLYFRKTSLHRLMRNPMICLVKSGRKTSLKTCLPLISVLRYSVICKQRTRRRMPTSRICNRLAAWRSSVPGWTRKAASTRQFRAATTPSSSLPRWTSGQQTLRQATVFQLRRRSKLCFHLQDCSSGN